MGIFFESYESDRCCLCGSPESLTGEHKIKASALRAIFRQNAMVIGHFDGTSAPRPAQGPKSQAFHFSARMCALCNSTRTQAADREFDRFHAQVIARLAEDKDPASVFDLPRYDIGSEPYLNVFRYFAKLLCCHVAESCGPRAISVREFAIGRMDRNPVFLHIDTDPTYAAYSTTFGEHQFAGHGGLIVPVDARIKLPTSFRSSLSLGAVRYIFWVRYGPMIGLALRMFHRDFWSRCEAAYRDALENPLSDEERHRIGV